MNIVIVCDVLGEKNNGTTIAAMNLIRAMKERGHQVRVVCPDRDRQGEEGFYVVPPINFGPLNGYVRKNGVVPARLDRAVLEMALQDADVIHVMLPFALGKAAARYAQEHHIPLTAGFHCQAENITSHLFLKNSKIVSRLVYRVLYGRLYRYCDCIHYPTAFIRDVFEAVVGPTPNRVISNGVSEAYHPIQVERSLLFQGRYVVLFTGRFSREKAHRVLIDAVALSRHRDEIQLIFAGTGPLAEQLLKRAKRKRIPRPILGFYDREELVRVINEADLYVHPAEIEIESIACLEAIACGRVPLIADAPRSATRYFALDDKNLFRYNDPRDLARKMDWWLEHPGARADRAKKYLGFAHAFEFEACMDAMEAMLAEVVEARRES